MDRPSQVTDLVKTEQPESTPAIVPPDPFAGRRQLAVYLDQDTPERIAQLGRALNLDETSWPESPTPLEIVGVTVWSRRVSKHDETPEKYGCYVALHCLDGSNHVTASRVVLDGLPDLAAAYGPPPWPRGVTVTIGRIRKGSATIGRCYCAPGDLTIAPPF